MAAIVRDYLYDVLSFRVVDGDTIEVVLDLGLDPITAARVVRITKTKTVGINAAEMKDGGAAAKQFVIDWCEGKTLIVRTWKLKSKAAKHDRYRRIIAEVYDKDTGESLAEALLEAGLVVVEKYR